MAEEEVIYDQVEQGDPDPLGLRKKAAAKQPSKADPLGLRAKVAIANPPAPQEPTQAAFQVSIHDPSYGKPIYPYTGESGTVISPDGTKGAKEFTYTKEPDQLGIYKLQGKATQASEALHKEIQGNDDVKLGLVKHRTPLQKMGDADFINTSETPIIRAAGDIERLGLEDRKETPRGDIRTDEGDLKTANDYIKSERNNASAFLNEVTKKHPEKAKEIQKNAYYIDAFNSAASDPNGNERINKINENAKAIERGDLLYDHKNQVLIKPEGFFGSLFEAREELNRVSDAYDRIKSMQDNGNIGAIISELNAKMKGDPDEPRRVPQGALGEFGHLLGGQTIKGLAAGGVAAGGTTLLGNPEAAGAAFQLASGLMNARDMYKIGKQNALEQNYIRLKSERPDMPDFDAYTQANELAEKQAVVDAAAAGVMQYFGAKVGFGAAKQLSKGISSGLSQIKDELGKKAFEAAGIGAIGSAGQIVKNIMAQRSGIETPTTEGALDAFKSGVLMVGGMALLGTAFNQLKPGTRNRISYGLGQMPDEALNHGLNSLEQSGQLKPEQVENVRNIINEQKAFEQLIPDNLPESDRIKIGGKIKERAELKQQLEQVDEAFHPEIKDKIKKINEDIINISKGGERGELQKLMDKEYKGTDPYFKDASENELKSFLKVIAEMAYDPERASSISFSDKIINKAKELYPQKESSVSVTYPKKTGAESTVEGVTVIKPETEAKSGVSVIQPGEINRPETITIKPKDNAIPERSAETPIVDETPGGGQPMGEGISEPREAAIPQEGQPAIPTQENPSQSKEGQVSEPELIGITHAEMDKVSRELGLPEYSKDPESFDSWTREAKDRLAKDPDAVNKLVNKLRNGDMPDPVETQMMKMHFAALKERYNNNPTPELRAELARTKDLYNISGRNLGKSLGARKGLIPQEDSLADFHMRDVEYNKNAPLTDEQVVQSTKEFNEIKTARDTFEAKLKIAEEENTKLKAEKKLQQEAKAAKKDSNKDYKEERKQILKDIGDKWKKSSKEGFGVSVVPYAKELAAIAPDVLKLVRNVVEEGIAELPKVIKSVHSQIKDIIPGITEKDIHDIIAGEHTKKQSRSQLATTLFDLKKEAQLMNQLDQLLKGEVPINEKKLRQRNQRIEELRSQIKDLKDEMGLNEKGMEEKLEALKGRYKSQIKGIEEKIAKGDFGPDEKTTPIKLDKEAIELKDKMIKLKLDREARLAKQEYDSRNNFQKGKDLAADALDATRTIQTNPDLSFFGRQGIKYLVTHPVQGPKLFWESARQAASQKRYDRWLHDMHNSPAWDLMDKSGLAVLDPHTLHASKREEQWRSQLIHKIPIAGQIAKASERAFTSAANMARADWFMEGVNILEKQGKTFENSPEEYKGWASAVNNMTGRGGLGALEGSVGQLAIPFWSPRLIASNVNLFLNPVYYSKMPKTARLMLIKNMAQYVVSGVAMLGLAKTLGADVEVDPRSSDFGKIKVGNTRYDIWGGAAQYIRALTQIFKAQRKSNGGIEKLDAKAQTIVGANLIRSKLSPLIGFGVDVTLGKNIVGEEVELKDAYKLMIPMLYNDIKDAYKDGGADQAAVSGLLSFLGIGAQTYAPKAKASGSTTGKPSKKGGPAKLSKHSKN
jgi:hypothetical protein